MTSHTDTTKRHNGGGDSTTHSAAPVVTKASSAMVRSGALDLELNGRRYRARWAQLGTVEHLRVNLRVEAGTNGSERNYVETIDLYSSRARRVYASRAGRALEASADGIDDDLAEVLVAVDKIQREVQQSAQGDAPADTERPEMTKAERRDAIALLKRKDLIDRIARDMDALGYVGEDTNKKLGYLIAVSRKLPGPLSAIIISQSGAGKSGLAGILEQLAPPEEVIFWSRLTPQALYYVERDFLKRKLVVIEEREGSEAADYSIRALQSKHKLVQAVPVKDPATGTIRTRTMEVEGPAAFLETTTRLHINPENASRCFELYLDESPTQTARVHEAQRVAKTAAGIERRERNQAIERVHQNAQRLLEPIAVAIPYAELLTFPAAWLRTRRDNLRLLNLIEAVAFLYQMQRPRKLLASGQEYIEATVEDYAIAYALAADVLGLGLDELRKPMRDLLAVIEAKLQEIAETRGGRAEAVDFTRRDVRTWSGLPNHQVKAVMQDLEELEYVEVRRAQRGSRYSYRLVVDPSSKRKSMTGLLTPVELFNRIGAAETSARREGLRRRGAAKVEKSGNRRGSSTFSTKSRSRSRT